MPISRESTIRCVVAAFQIILAHSHSATVPAVLWCVKLSLWPWYQCNLLKDVMIDFIGLQLTPNIICSTLSGTMRINVSCMHRAEPPSSKLPAHPAQPLCVFFLTGEPASRLEMRRQVHHHYQLLVLLMIPCTVITWHCVLCFRAGHMSAFYASNFAKIMLSVGMQ